MRARTVKANAVQEKLEFVLKITGQWAANGGLGRVDDDEEGRGEKLVWMGPSVPGQRQVDRITVGRCGGDGPRR